MAGIKESLEVVALVEAVAVALKAAMADKKIDFMDVLRKETRDLLPAAQAAVEGIQAVPGEVKDLDAQEVAQITAAAYKAGKALVDAVKLAA